MIPCIHSIGCTLGGADERFSDWCNAMPAIAITLSMTVTIAATVQCFLYFTVTATEDLNRANIQFNPLVLLFQIQRQTMIPIDPSSTFLAGFVFLSSQRSANSRRIRSLAAYIMLICPLNICLDVVLGEF
jgi:hypothetical protein